jgi:ankyrin repeat protein
LHKVVRARDAKMLSTLLQKEGINVNLQDQMGKTILIAALDEGYNDIVEILLNEAPNRDTAVKSSLCLDLNLFDKKGKTALIHAIQSQNEQALRCLFSYEASTMSI